MELFPRSEPLERVGEAGEACAPSRDQRDSVARDPAGRDQGHSSHARLRRVDGRAAPPRAAVRESIPAPREGLGEGARTLCVIAASLGAHVAFAGVLAVLPATSSMFAAPPIEIEMSFAAMAPIEAAPIEEVVPEPVAPEPVAPEPVAPEPVAVARAERPRAAEAEPVVQPEPEVVPPAPAAIGSTPPSLDDVFGDPAPSLETMGAESGGFAIAAGAPGGRAGGVAGGTGTLIGGGGGGSGVGAAAPSGPSTADIRRARRAYGDQVRAHLARHAADDYPIAARAQRLGGRVQLALRIGEDGRLLAARVVGSSGYAMLDAAAIATANGIASFPRPPTLVPWDPRDEITIPVVYQVTR